MFFLCSNYVRYAFQSESTLYSSLNVKELLAWNRHKIWNLSDCNGTQTHNHLVCKWTLNHLAKLAKWLSCVVSTYLYGAFDCMFLLCHIRVSEWIHTQQLPEYQELLARNRCKIWNLSDCNWTQTRNHLVLTQTLKHLAKLAKWIQLQSLKLQISCLFRAWSSLHSGNYRVWVHSEMRTWLDKNIQSNALYR